MICIIDKLFVLLKFDKFSFKQFGPWDYFVGIDRSKKSFFFNCHFKSFNFIFYYLHWFSIFSYVCFLCYVISEIYFISIFRFTGIKSFIMFFVILEDEVCFLNFLWNITYMKKNLCILNGELREYPQIEHIYVITIPIKKQKLTSTPETPFQSLTKSHKKFLPRVLPEVLCFTFRIMIHFELCCIWCEVWIKFHVFA